MTLGVILALVAALSRYVDGHFHDQEAFVQNNAALADNADVRERIFQGFRDEIIALADGEPIEEDASADDDSNGLEELFGTADDEEDSGDDPVTDARIERDLAIEGILLDALDSDLYQEAFVDSLEVAQTQTIRTADLRDAELLRDNGEVSFDMRRLYPPIYAALAADARTAEITTTEVPDSYGIFPVADRDTTYEWVWSGIRNGPRWRTLALLGAVVSLLGAVVVADRRPSTILQFGGGMLGLAGVVAVVVYVIRALIPLLVESGSSAGSVAAVYGATTWPLIRAMAWLGGLGLVLLVLGSIARFIWPDDWVLDHVTDTRGTRSTRRRRGKSEPEPQPQPAAPVQPVPGYGYPPPGYGYPPGWGQGYPQQPWGPPGYGYGQPQYGQPPQATPAAGGPAAGRPTVPVVPVAAAQAVPVVAPVPDVPASDSDTGEVVVPTANDSEHEASPPAGDDGGEVVATVDAVEEQTTADGWSAESDW